MGNVNFSKEVAVTNKRNVFDAFSTTVSGIFSPVLGILAASGTIKGILSILQVSHILKDDSGTYIIIFAISNTFFYFMPVVLGASAAKYFKIDSYLGMIIGASMIYPSLIPYISEGNLTFLGLSVNMTDYTFSVFPVIIAVWFASKIERQIQKIPLREIRFLIQPMLILIVIIPSSLLAIGPFVSWFSKIIAVMMDLVYSFSPIIAGIVLGGTWILLIILGLHWLFIPIFISNIAVQGYNPILGLLLASQFAIAGASFAAGLKSEKEDLTALCYSVGVTTLIGVAEPALYGVLLPLKRPLVAAVIGGSVGAMIAGMTNTVQYAFGGFGLLGIPLIINSKGIDVGFYGGIASQIIGFTVAFLITLVWGLKKEVNKKEIKADLSMY
ncbi:PTS transporter subunit EIIC [Enterococcus hirae]|uniref:PTS transporter subunit EIIC n=1 Tax=Enterococcus hirae TaxID=1354 RepID=UPI001A97967C|nr:PTS transporter subunit EIIC [Enterococcus hirae]MBO1089580.1 PTS beta-glucoside transporter subunit EIIBCA [Enterococcus hirae]MEB7517696.1 PTS transporter subunit EIIC [Enterococcus hirae]